MKSISTLSVLVCFLLSGSILAQITPDLEVTSVHVYEYPYTPPGIPVQGDTVEQGDRVVIAFDMKNNGPDLKIGDTIHFKWNRGSGLLRTDSIPWDIDTDSTQRILVIGFSKLNTLGKWEVCIWPVYSNLGFSNADSTVGNSCKEIEVVAGAPDLEVTSVYVYEYPYVSPGIPVQGDTVEQGDRVVIAFDMKNNGPDLKIGDTIHFKWNRAGSSLLRTDSIPWDIDTDSTQRILVVGFSKLNTLGKWEVCIWPVYSNLGFSNADSTVGASCKEIEVVSAITGVGDAISDQTFNMYYSNGLLHIKHDIVDQKEMMLTIYSLEGKRVHQEKIRMDQNDQFSINLEHLNTGLYVVHLNGLEFSSTIKMIR